MEKRGNVIEEIITTEKNYVTKLQLVQDMIIKPLQAEKILDADDIKTQFGFWEALCCLHSSLYNRMIEERDANVLEIGKIFKDFSYFLKMYTQYLINFDIARARRGWLVTNNRRFAEFCDKMKYDDATFHGMGIEAYLIEPVQRIPRYRLLLEQLMKYTAVDHVEYDIIKEALQLVSEVASHNNEAIRERENKDKMMEVMMSFEPRTRVNLFDDIHRNFLKEGLLQKQCRRGIKEFRYWLFSDKLLYGESNGLGSYKVNRQILFHEMRITTSECNCFVIESKAKSFVTFAKDEVEMKEWYHAIIEAMIARQKYLLSSSSTSSSSSSSTSSSTSSSIIQDDVAPLWTPNQEKNQCELCYTPFTLFYRRHHCRQCGKLVCDPCSSCRMMIAHIDPIKPVRTCDDCVKKSSSSSSSSPLMSSGRSFRISSIVGGLSLSPLIRNASKQSSITSLSSSSAVDDGDSTPSSPHHLHPTSSSAAVSSYVESPGSTASSRSASIDIPSSSSSSSSYPHHPSLMRTSSMSRRSNIDLSPGHSLYHIREASSTSRTLPAVNDDDSSDDEMMENPGYDTSSPLPTMPSSPSSPSHDTSSSSSSSSSSGSSSPPPKPPRTSILNRSISPSTSSSSSIQADDIPSQETIRTVIQRKSAIYATSPISDHLSSSDRDAMDILSSSPPSSSSSSSSSMMPTRRASVTIGASGIESTKNPLFTAKESLSPPPSSSTSTSVKTIRSPSSSLSSSSPSSAAAAVDDIINDANNIHIHDNSNSNNNIINVQQHAPAKPRKSIRRHSVTTIMNRSSLTSALAASLASSNGTLKVEADGIPEKNDEIRVPTDAIGGSAS